VAACAFIGVSQLLTPLPRSRLESILVVIRFYYRCGGYGNRQQAGRMRNFEKVEGDDY
jgi:hypothetical protein